MGLKQKKGQKGLDAAQKAAAKDVQKWKELRQKADAATSNAVTVARDSGDKAKISSAKTKAHGLYTKMVDEKVRVAAAHHKVIAGKEATALKKVAGDRHTIAVAAEKEAQAQF